MSVTNEKTPAIARERFVDPQRKQCGRVSNPCRPCRPSSCPSLSCPCRELLVNLEPRNVERTRNDSRSPSDPSIVGESRAAATAFAAGRTQYLFQRFDVAAIVQRNRQAADVNNLPGRDLALLGVIAEHAGRDADDFGRLWCSEQSFIVGTDFVRPARLSLPCCLLCHGCFHLLPLVPRDRPTYAARCAHPISASLVPQVKFVPIHAADSARPAGCRPLPSAAISIQPLLAI